MTLVNEKIVLSQREFSIIPHHNENTSHIKKTLLSWASSKQLFIDLIVISQPISGHFRALYLLYLIGCSKHRRKTQGIYIFCFIKHLLYLSWLNIICTILGISILQQGFPEQLPQYPTLSISLQNQQQLLLDKQNLFIKYIREKKTHYKALKCNLGYLPDLVHFMENISTENKKIPF